MSRLYRQRYSCSPSNQRDAYIYCVAPVANARVAAITSAAELLTIDGRHLQPTTIFRFDGCPQGITALTTSDRGQRAICAGSDGNVISFDVQAGLKISEFKIDQGVTALACRDYDLAVGTEFDQHRHQAVVSVWDLRQNKMRWHNSENHDDITALDFHPEKSEIVLSGGDDGLVSLFDTRIHEEEDSLVQAFNHGPIHKAGFLSGRAIYALSSDENLAIHPVYSEGREEEPKPLLLGDLRPVVPCEYVIDLFRSGDHMVVATGTHSKSQVDLVTIDSDGILDLANRIVLPEGEEIVRSVFADDQNGTIFTGGEDGQIKAFRPLEGDDLSKPLKPSGGTTSSGTTPKGTKSGGKRGEGRFKPY